MLILNLGCGVNRRRLYSEPFPEGVVHIDRNPDVHPDIVQDLDLGLPVKYCLGEFANKVDEIHAYHIVEHLGVMGDTRVWFQFWRDCWRALKPGGLMYVLAPWFQHEDAVGDPTHVRLICKQTYHFLNRQAYAVKEGQFGCAMSKLAIDFDLQVAEHKLMNKSGEFVPCTLATVLRAVKTADGELVPMDMRKDWQHQKEAATV